MLHQWHITTTTTAPHRLEPIVPTTESPTTLKNAKKKNNQLSITYNPDDIIALANKRAIQNAQHGFALNNDKLERSSMQYREHAQLYASTYREAHTAKWNSLSIETKITAHAKNYVSTRTRKKANFNKAALTKLASKWGEHAALYEKIYKEIFDQKSAGFRQEGCQFVLFNTSLRRKELPIISALQPNATTVQNQQPLNAIVMNTDAIIVDAIILDEHELLDLQASNHQSKRILPRNI